jgi:hypothetical protein
MNIDLSVLPSGKRYEDRYGAYMAIFQQVAECNDPVVTVTNPPASWIPLLRYLNVEVIGFSIPFQHDGLARDAIRSREKFLDRTAVEVLCGFRPETTDALWKVDMQWTVAQNRQGHLENKKEFIVTNNGSFHRPEVLEFKDHLWNYIPEKKKVVLVPCAADKPYPSRMHKAVLDRMPKDYYLANATGVLGLVPQDLWPVMPHYDSGLPYEWRLMQTVERYFTVHRHEKIVAYVDYYSEAIYRGLFNAGCLDGQLQIRTRADRGLPAERVVFVNPIMFYFDYLPLHEEKYLKKLEEAFKEN